MTNSNESRLEAEIAKLESWADDQKKALQRELKALDRQIKEARSSARSAETLADKLAGQLQVKDLETKRKNKRRDMFDAEDEIDRQRDEMIEQMRTRLEQENTAAAQ